MNAQNRRLLDEINNEPTFSSRLLVIYIIFSGICVLMISYGVLT